MAQPDLARQADEARRAGKLTEAAALLERALEGQASSHLLNNLGGLLEELGRADEAIARYTQAAALAPEAMAPHFNAGDLLRRRGQLDDALPLLRAAATLDPNQPAAWSALGEALLARGEPTAALAAWRRAVELAPADSDAHRGRGDALQMLRRFDEAIASYTEAVWSNATNAEAWYGLGRARLETGAAALARDAFDHCLAITPDHGPALNDLGRALFELGRVEQAMGLLRRAAEGPPGVREQALLNLAVIVPGSPDDNHASILATRRAWARGLPARRPSHHPHRPGPIALGYVSSFFHKPNWMKPVWALINRHDRSRFRVHLFSDAPASQIQGGYRPHPDDRFHDMTGLDNAAIAELIERQGIDVLIDLNGYSAPERLGIYPLRPAPRIVGWFNLYATSGLDCLDALIGDDSVIRPEEEQHYSERVRRVPGSYLAFEVDHPAPDIAPVPCAGGVFTFGSLASQYKITDQVVRTWSEVLRRCPAARLLIRNATLGRPEHRADLLARFATHGIADRLLLEGPAEHLEFLRTYDRIDVVLDPFPYSGGTTTTEALWQGVPVVTFDGDRWAARTSVSLLNAAGLSDFVGKSLADYVDICDRLAQSPDTVARLTVFRATARDRLRGSPVCDADGLARAMEAIYRELLDAR